jgi:hypothetical protein
MSLREVIGAILFWMVVAVGFVYVCFLWMDAGRMLDQMGRDLTRMGHDFSR